MSRLDNWSLEPISEPSKWVHAIETSAKPLIDPKTGNSVKMIVKIVGNTCFYDETTEEYFLCYFCELEAGKFAKTKAEIIICIGKTRPEG